MHSKCPSQDAKNITSQISGHKVTYAAGRVGFVAFASIMQLVKSFFFYGVVLMKLYSDCNKDCTLSSYITHID